MLLVSGSSGLIGTALVAALRQDGIDVLSLSRSARVGANAVRWDPGTGELDGAKLDGVEAVVHLAGEPLAGGRWTSAKKRRIRGSRVDGTGGLARTLAGLPTPPKVLICASAIGYYGDRGDELLTEDSDQGRGFLAEVCRDWEAAADPAREAGIRVVHTRFGLVLSPQGGALRQMLVPFRLGLGGVVGSGRQYWSWITLSDAVAAIRIALDAEAIHGPVNLVAPNPETCRSFVKSLGVVLHRPTFVPLPAFAARMAFGEMANETILASTRVRPKRLEEAGFEFGDRELEPALKGLMQSE